MQAAQPAAGGGAHRTAASGVVFWAALLSACGDPSPDVTFTRDVAPLFEASCAECHRTTERELADPDLSAEVAYGDLVDHPAVQAPDMVRIAPGDVDGSYLWHKLVGTHEAAGGEGAQMPYGRPPLPARELDVIRQWIEQGASE